MRGAFCLERLFVESLIVLDSGVSDLGGVAWRSLIKLYTM